MQAALPQPALSRWRDRFSPYGEGRLLLALLLEVGVFSAVADNFFTWDNFFEIVRYSVELGLIALALTPVIITGGIDLSVGSMMGLCAVSFGYLWRDLHFSIPAAAVSSLLVGIAGGALRHDPRRRHGQ